MEFSNVDLCNKIQWYLGNDEDVGNLSKVVSGMDIYYHDWIKYDDIKVGMRKDRILRLIINGNVDLSEFTNLVGIRSGCVMRGCHLELDYIPENVEELYLHNSNLTRLPDILPSKLRILDISNNPIDKLPYLPKSIKYCIAKKTNIEILPDKRKGLIVVCYK